MTEKLDTLDKELIRLLCKDGQAPVADLAKRLPVTTPTVRTRIKRSITSGLLRITGSINTQNHPELISALVAMKVQSLQARGSAAAPGKDRSGHLGGGGHGTVQHLCRGGGCGWHRGTARTHYPYHPSRGQGRSIGNLCRHEVDEEVDNDSRRDERVVRGLNGRKGVEGVTGMGRRGSTL